MKIFSFVILMLLNISCGQKVTLSSHQSPGGETPMIYFSGEMSADDNRSMDVNYLYTKIFVKDTSINGVEYKKFKWDKFKDYNKTHEVYYEFERSTEDEYILLDEKLKDIHNLKLKPEEQKGILFGNEGNIGYEYIDTRTYSPKSDFVPDAASPIKFYFSDDRNVFVYCEIADRKKIEVSFNKGEFKKSLTEGAFNTAAQILTHNDSAKASYDIQQGDELQLVYTVGRTEFSSKGTIGKDSEPITGERKESSSKEVTTMKCINVKREGNKKIIYLDGVNFDSRKNKTENTSQSVEIDEDGNVMIDNQIMGKEQMYKLDFKIDSLDISKIPEEYRQSEMSKKFFTFTGVTYDTLSGTPFPRVVYINSANYYQMYYLSYFPVPYAEYPGTTCRVSYVKLKDKEFGRKE